MGVFTSGRSIEWFSGDLALIDTVVSDGQYTMVKIKSGSARNG